MAFFGVPKDLGAPSGLWGTADGDSGDTGGRRRPGGLGPGAKVTWPPVTGGLGDGQDGVGTRPHAGTRGGRTCVAVGVAAEGALGGAVAAVATARVVALAVLGGGDPLQGEIVQANAAGAGVAQQRRRALHGARVRDGLRDTGRGRHRGRAGALGGTSEPGGSGGHREGGAAEGACPGGVT